MVKNDGVQRRLIGRIVTRFEEKGLLLVQARVCMPTMDILRQHYSEHVDKPFFQSMAEGMCQSQVFPMVWEGANAVAVARRLIGATRPTDAETGSIRGDYGMWVGKNVIHGAESVEAAMREVKIWFGDDIADVKQFDRDLIYE